MWWVLAVLVVLVCVGIVIDAWPATTKEQRPIPALPAATPAGPAAVDVGDCVQAIPESDEDLVSKVSCSEPHEGEVFAVLRVESDGSSFPSPVTWLHTSLQRCVDAFPRYGGTTVSRSGLDVHVTWPSEYSWSHGDRHVVCYLVAMGAGLEGVHRAARASAELPAERTLFTLAAGECFSSDAFTRGALVAAVELSPCGEPHGYEAIGAIDIPDTVEFDNADSYVEQRCTTLFAAYLGRAYSGSPPLNWTLPTAYTWDSLGDRSATCIVGDGSVLTSSVRNSGH